MTLLCIFLLAAILCFALLYYTRELTPHEKQQAALRRHRKWQDKERKKHISYWKAHGNTIRPRYCSELDEREPLT